MPTRQRDLWKAIMDGLASGEWTSLQSIYRFVEENVELKPDDFDPSAPSNDSPRWQRNVRNVLQHRKTIGEVEWSGSGRYRLPNESDKTNVETSYSTRHKIGEDELCKVLERQREIGRKGEDYVVAIERESLMLAGRKDLAERVVRVSVDDVGAGYDILSFDSLGNEKFIEVKSTVGRGYSFEWTTNELEVARTLAERYWLYYVQDLEGNPSIERFQDPASLIDKLFTLTPFVYRITFRTNQ